MRTTASSILVGSLAVLLSAASALGEPTEITVRVLSKDAKFVGTSMGGVQILVRDAETGAVLAQGVTSGGTGDTERIMKRGRSRGVPLATEGAARYQAVIDIAEPRLVEVVAYGPLAQRQAANRVSATQWVVPGKHITAGDAWLLELPGLVVDVLAPPAHFTVGAAPRPVEIRSNVVMM